MFECTRPGIRRRGAAGWEVAHQKPWELRVQSKLRAGRPPVEPPEYMIVGLDEHGLAAVLTYRELDGPAQVELAIGAVALRCRGKGGGYADEMLEEGLDRIAERAYNEGIDVIHLSTLVHESNRASHSLCRRLQMRHTGMFSETLQQWTAVLYLGEEQS